MPERLARTLGILPLPGGADLRVNIALSGLFAMLFGVVYIGADLISATVYERNLVAFAFETHIPFVPQMAIVYLSIIPLLLLGPVILETPRKLFPLFVVLSLEVLVAGVSFILFPMKETFPSHPTEGGFFFRAADVLNLHHNDLPSLHVALSLTAAVTYSKFCNLAGKAVFYAWAALIVMSSLLMHQHHIADIVAGGLLAAAAMLLVYPLVSRQSFFDAVRVECICVSEFARFARRHPRYLVIAFYLYANAPFHWRRMRTMRAGFCLLQAIDDLLDGDRPSEADPVDLAETVTEQLASGHFAADPDRYALLAETLAHDLRRLPDAGEDALDDVIALIRHMTVDRERALRGALFDTAGLRRHHRETFVRSVNLLLIVAGAKLRAGDVPALIEAFGWCSTMRDLREDLEHGLVNIPTDVVAAARAEGADLFDYETLIRTDAMRDWFAVELERAWHLLDTVGDRTANPTDKTGERIVTTFHHSMLRFAGRFETQYGLAVRAQTARSGG